MKTKVLPKGKKNNIKHTEDEQVVIVPGTGFVRMPCTQEKYPPRLAC